MNHTIEERARVLYERARRDVEGRPSWEELNLQDPYDAGMRDHAIHLASNETEKVEVSG